MKIFTTMIMTVFIAVNAFADDIISDSVALKNALEYVKGIPIEIRLHNRDIKDGPAYEIKIFDKASSGIKKVDVSAINGRIIEIRWESVKQHKAQMFSLVKIGYNQAVDKALESYPNSKIKKAELKIKGKKPVYKIDFLSSSGIEYEAYVDSINADILHLQQDDVIFSTPDITLSQAEIKAKEAINGDIIYTELDEDDDEFEYKVLILANNTLYEVKINAYTGNILRVKEK